MVSNPPPSLSSSIPLDIPPSSSTGSVSIKIIDTTMVITDIPTALFMGPDIPDFSKFSISDFAFLITHTNHSTGAQKHVLFDMGGTKDWETELPPVWLESVKGSIASGAHLRIEKNFLEILEEGGFELQNIEELILSHPHWDHIGRPALFPHSTKLVVGPGVKKEHFPGYPTVADTPLLQQDFEGRETVELSFDSSTLAIGGLPAVDYFDDGTVYLLDAPGHCLGHINALVRTTSNPDTFMFLGADSFHHGGQVRPNEHTPLPSLLTLPNFTPSPCPGELFHSIHPSKRQGSSEIPSYADFLVSANSNSSPFFTISEFPDGTSVAPNPGAARDVISKIQAFDADERVFVVASHDQSLHDVLEYFPKPANDWKVQGWKETGRWKFLTDFGKAVVVATT